MMVRNEKLLRIFQRKKLQKLKFYNFLIILPFLKILWTEIIGKWKNEDFIRGVLSDQCTTTSETKKISTWGFCLIGSIVRPKTKLFQTRVSLNHAPKKLPWSSFNAVVKNRICSTTDKVVEQMKNPFLQQLQTGGLRVCFINFYKSL